MRRIRFVALGIVSFVVCMFGALLAPGTFLNRALSAALCTVFSFNSAVCTASLVQSSNRVVAATPPAVERSIADISGYLQAQRDPSEFGDVQPSAPSPGSNPQAPPFPQDPGPNFPVRPEFDGADSERNNTTTGSQKLGFGNTTLSFDGENGCRETYTVKSNDGLSYIDSITVAVAVNSVCNNSSPLLSAQLSSDSNTIIFSFANYREMLKIQGLNSKIWTVIYKDTSGNEQSRQIQVKQNNKFNVNKEFGSKLKQKPIRFNEPIITKFNDIVAQKNKNLPKPLCERYREDLRRAKEDCEFWRRIDMLTFGELKSLITAGIGRSVPISVISAIIYATQTARSLRCSMLFGERFENAPIQAWKETDPTFAERMEASVKDNMEILSKGCDDETGQCGEAQVNQGGRGVTNRTFPLNATRGTITIFYEMCPNPDQLDVFYEGTRIGGTPGRVSGSGSLRIPFRGSSDTVTVRVAAPGEGTEWAFKLFCPGQQVPQNIGKLRECN